MQGDYCKLPNIANIEQTVETELVSLVWVTRRASNPLNACSLNQKHSHGGVISVQDMNKLVVLCGVKIMQVSEKAD